MDNALSQLRRDRSHPAEVLRVRTRSKAGVAQTPSDPLAALLGSETRAAVLKVLFQSQQLLYINEIMRLTGRSQQGVDDQLRKLGQMGLIVSRTDRGRGRYFEPNKEHPFYPHVRALIEVATR